MAVTGKDDNALRFIDLATRAVGPPMKGERSDAQKTHCSDKRCVSNNANAVALSPDGRPAYVASMVRNCVGIVDLEAPTMVGSFRTGNTPRTLALSKREERAYVLNDGANTVVAINLAARKMVGKPVVVGKNSLSDYQHSQRRVRRRCDDQPGQG